MKRLQNLFPGFLIVFFITMISGFSSAAAQKATREKQYPIPDNIKSIFQSSCMSCHGDKGGRLPTSKLKFTRWKAYGANKQAEKASMICFEIMNGKMPPKTERLAHPEKIPTTEQVELICKWAESLKPQRGK
jgi:mono/diheme cytochrome c family protein